MKLLDVFITFDARTQTGQVFCVRRESAILPTAVRVAPQPERARTRVRTRHSRRRPATRRVPRRRRRPRAPAPGAPPTIARGLHSPVREVGRGREGCCTGLCGQIGRVRARARTTSARMMSTMLGRRGRGPRFESKLKNVPRRERAGSADPRRSTSRGPIRNGEHSRGSMGRRDARPPRRGEGGNLPSSTQCEGVPNQTGAEGVGVEWDGGVGGRSCSCRVCAYRRHEGADIAVEDRRCRTFRSASR